MTSKLPSSRKRSINLEQEEKHRLDYEMTSNLPSSRKRCINLGQEQKHRFDNEMASKLPSSRKRNINLEQKVKHRIAYELKANLPLSKRRRIILEDISQCVCQDLNGPTYHSDAGREHYTDKGQLQSAVPRADFIPLKLPQNTEKLPANVPEADFKPGNLPFDAYGHQAAVRKGDFRPGTEEHFAAICKGDLRLGTGKLPAAVPRGYFKPGTGECLVAVPKGYFRPGTEKLPAVAPKGDFRQGTEERLVEVPKGYFRPGAEKLQAAVLKGGVRPGIEKLPAAVPKEDIRPGTEEHLVALLKGDVRPLKLTPGTQKLPVAVPKEDVRPGTEKLPAAVPKGDFKPDTEKHPAAVPKGDVRPGSEKLPTAVTKGGCIQVKVPPSKDELPAAVPKGDFRPLKLPPGKEPALIMFDLETTDLIRGPRVPHITQISAMEPTSGSVFNSYVTPKVPVSVSAQQITGIVMSSRGMSVNGHPVCSESVRVALNRFTEWLESYANVMLVAHNGRNFDYPILMSTLMSVGLVDRIFHTVFAFVDSLPVFRKKYPNLSSYKQNDLVSNLLNKTYAAHNAVEDVKYLGQLVLHKPLSVNELLPFTFSPVAVYHQRLFAIKKSQNLGSLRPLIYGKVVTKTTAENIAGSGLSLRHLQKIFDRDGEDGLIDTFTCQNEAGQPRVTIAKRTLKDVIPKLGDFFRRKINK